MRDDPRRVFFPDLDDPREEPYWAGTRNGELRLPQCTRCGTLRWPATVHCPECLSDTTVWATVSPCGRLWSYTIYRRAMNPAFRDRIPYAVGLIELDAGVRMLGTLDIDFDELRPDMRVTADFERVDDRLSLPHWRAVSATECVAGA